LDLVTQSIGWQSVVSLLAIRYHPVKREVYLAVSLASGSGLRAAVEGAVRWLAAAILSAGRSCLRRSE
jgi:hypothetical protein